MEPTTTTVRVARIVRTSERKRDVAHLIAFHSVEDGTATTLCGYREPLEPVEPGDGICKNCSATLRDLNAAI